MFLDFFGVFWYVWHKQTQLGRYWSGFEKIFADKDAFKVFFCVCLLLTLLQHGIKWLFCVRILVLFSLGLWLRWGLGVAAELPLAPLGSAAPPWGFRSSVYGEVEVVYLLLLRCSVLFCIFFQPLLERTTLPHCVEMQFSFSCCEDLLPYAAFLLAGQFAHFLFFWILCLWLQQFIARPRFTCLLLFS